MFCSYNQYTTISQIFRQTPNLFFEDDLTRGITVYISDAQQATICVKIVAESGKNIPGIVEKINVSMTKSVQSTTGLAIRDIAVDVADTMTRREYEETNGSDVDYHDA